MESNVNQKVSKSIFHTEDGLTVWITSNVPDTTSIMVTDHQFSITYNVADFDGCKYEIKHFGKFNDVFLKSAKKRPQMIRELLKFHKTVCAGIDGIDELKVMFRCFKRRVSIYTKKTFKHTKLKLFN